MRIRPEIVRRDFIRLGAALGGSLVSAAPAKPVFPVQARERLAVSTYPFRSLINSPDSPNASPRNATMTLEQFAGAVMEKLNVPGIEPWSHHFQSTGADYVRHLSESFHRAGMHVVNIPVDIEEHVCESHAGRQAGLQAYRKWVDAAVILGSPGIRVHLPHGESGDRISCAVSIMKDVAAYGATKDVVISLENDEPDTEQPDRIAAVVKAVSSKYLRALPDFCNSMLIHDDVQYNYRAMEMLFPLASTISHVKDQEEENGKVYRVDVARFFSIAKKAGYRGYFSMEWEGKGDPYGGTRKLIKASLNGLS